MPGNHRVPDRPSRPRSPARRSPAKNRPTAAARPPSPTRAVNQPPKSDWALAAMTIPEVFTSEQRNLVGRAAREAEREVARYYCIPPRGWQQFPYDLLTQEDQGARPLPDPVLAE